MNLIVDGIVFEDQEHGGISRIFSETLPRICQLDSTLDIQLLTSGPTKQPVPDHDQIHQTRIANPQMLISNRMFPYLKRNVRSVLLGKAVSHFDERAIWHSTYFTLASNWKGLNILTIPDLIPELFPSQYNRFIQEQFCRYRQKCIEMADAIICISESTAADLRTFYPLSTRKEIFVIPLAANKNFYPTPLSPETSQLPTQKEFLLYVGGRQYYKNFKSLLDVYAEWEHHSIVDLVVVGVKWSSSELKLIKDLNLERDVHLVTKVNDSELARLYNLALAFVYPSLYEGFGIPLLEAMQCGCPIVASRIPSTVEVAGKCPIYFDPAKREALLHALTLAVEEQKDENRIKSGFKHTQNYSWEQCAKKTFEVYANLLDKPKSCVI